MLPVSAPFHCSMLQKAGDKLASELGNINIHHLKIPVMSNVTADYYTNENIKELLIKQVSHSVLWEDTIMKMLEEDVNQFIELGPGRALTGFVKKITKKMNRDISFSNVEDENTLKVLLEKMKE